MHAKMLNMVIKNIFEFMIKGGQIFWTSREHVFLSSKESTNMYFIQILTDMKTRSFTPPSFPLQTS